jgi:hypothetical protein
MKIDVGVAAITMMEYYICNIDFLLHMTLVESRILLFTDLN